MDRFPSQTYNSSEKKFGMQYKRRLTHLSIVEMIFGVVAILCGIINASITSSVDTADYWRSRQHQGLAYTAAGIWCGGVILAMGVTGIISTKKSKLCMINGSMVASVLAAFFSLILVVIEAFAVVFALFVSCNSSYSGYYHYGYQSTTMPSTSSPNTCQMKMTALTAFHVLLCLIGVASMICAIVHSVFCCSSVCCGRGSNASRIIYVTDQSNLPPSVDAKPVSLPQQAVSQHDVTSDQEKQNTASNQQRTPDGSMMETPPPYGYAPLKNEINAIDTQNK